MSPIQLRFKEKKLFEFCTVFSFSKSFLTHSRTAHSIHWWRLVLVVVAHSNLYRSIPNAASVSIDASFRQLHSHDRTQCYRLSINRNNTLNWAPMKRLAYHVRHTDCTLCSDTMDSIRDPIRHIVPRHSVPDCMRHPSCECSDFRRAIRTMRPFDQSDLMMAAACLTTSTHPNLCSHVIRRVYYLLFA